MGLPMTFSLTKEHKNHPPHSPLDKGGFKGGSNEEYIQHFREKVAQQRIPLSCSIELTHRCNLRCVHCYLGPQSIHWKMRENELSTKKIISIIDEITEAGCLFLLITGGEPLLRKDFHEIYSHAKIKGLVITVFTNGTLITESTIELFKDLPPQTVEISLYGAAASTYEKITKVPGSFKKCLSGIKKLLDNKINVRLKTILMTLNTHEFFEIKKLAEEYGVKFRFDPAVSPCLNGDKSPLNFRVAPEDAVEKEFSDDTMIQRWEDYLNKYSGEAVTDTLYNCGAGINDFHIDPYGNLFPCLMMRDIKYNLLNGSFITGWNEVIPQIGEIKAGPDFICNICEKRDVCGFCPPFFELENSADDIYSEYHCAMSKLRYQTLQSVRLRGGI